MAGNEVGQQKMPLVESDKCQAFVVCAMCRRGITLGPISMMSQGNGKNPGDVSRVVLGMGWRIV